MKSRRARARIVSPLLCVLLFAGCAHSRKSISPPQPELGAELGAELEAERDAVSSQLLTNIIEEKTRLLGIQYVLNRTAAKACGELARPQFGIFTGSLASLDQPVLAKASAESGILGDGLKILHVVPDSPFERAGLRAGDELLEVDGKSPRSHGELNAQRLRITDPAPIAVRYRREERLYDARVPAELACPVAFTLSNSEAVVTFSRPAEVLVPRGLLASVRDEDLLAIALAHGFVHAAWDQPSNSRLENEQRADQLGTRLAATAGFDVSKTVQYWEDVARIHPWLVTPGPLRNKVRMTDGAELLVEILRTYGHDGIAVRLDGIRSAVATEAGG